MCGTSKRYNGLKDDKAKICQKLQKEGKAKKREKGKKGKESFDEGLLKLKGFNIDFPW